MVRRPPRSGRQQALRPRAAAPARELVDSGKVRGDDLVWRDGMGDWQAADQCPDLAAPARPQPQSYPIPDRRGGYGYDAGPRGPGPYGDGPYRRPYTRQSSAWILPVVIVGGVFAIGMMVLGGFTCLAIMNHRSSTVPSGTSYYPPATQPVDDPPFIPDQNPPVFVDPNAPLVVPQPDPPPFIDDPKPPDDHQNPP